MKSFLWGGLCGIVGSVATGLRLGCFGETVIQINKDDEYESVSNFGLWSTARWYPGDVHTFVYHNSWKPIRFEYTQEYSGYNSNAGDAVVNKNKS